MSFELEQMVNELESVLSMWDFFTKRTDLDPENTDHNTDHFGTWVDGDGDEHTCRSSAEASPCPCGVTIGNPRSGDQS